MSNACSEVVPFTLNIAEALIKLVILLVGRYLVVVEVATQLLDDVLLLADALFLLFELLLEHAFEVRCLSLVEGIL